MYTKLMLSSSRTYFRRKMALTRIFLLPLVLCLLVDHRLLAANADERIDFNFQIRPILSDRCFKCHGPDEKARKAKLRLDMPESALAIRDPSKGTRAISPGH